MLAARVEQKNGMKDDQNGVTPLDKESPIQAGCSNRARPDLCGGYSAMSIPTANLDLTGRRAFEVICFRHRRQVLIPWRAG
jgi:hypothetical protein